MKILARLLATFFPCGYVPVAPGTAASLAAIGLAWWMHAHWGVSGPGFGFFGWLLAGPAVWAAGTIARDSGDPDPRRVVVDEVVGQWVTLAGAMRLNWKSWLAALILFRVLDVWKPPPIRRLERLEGGVGIVADDVLAGIYGALVLLAAGWFNLY